MRVDYALWRRNECMKCARYTSVPGREFELGQCMATTEQVLACARRKLFAGPEDYGLSQDELANNRRKVAWLRKIRVVKNEAEYMSIPDMAKVLGCTISEYSDLEAGRLVDEKLLEKVKRYWNKKNPERYRQLS